MLVTSLMSITSNLLVRRFGCYRISVNLLVIVIGSDPCHFYNPLTELVNYSRVGLIYYSARLMFIPHFITYTTTLSSQALLLSGLHLKYSLMIQKQQKYDDITACAVLFFCCCLVYVPYIYFQYYEHSIH